MCTVQGEWISGPKSNQILTIAASSLQSVGGEHLPIIEMQTFLDTWSIITAEAVPRCNTCLVMKELHPNILSMQMSSCKSQVRGIQK